MMHDNYSVRMRQGVNEKVIEVQLIDRLNVELHSPSKACMRMYGRSTTYNTVTRDFLGAMKS